MDWQDVPHRLDSWTATMMAPAWELRKAAADIYTTAPIGFYLYADDPTLVALREADGPRVDFARCKRAAERVFGAERVCPVSLRDQDFSAPWVKVAHSTALRTLGEYLNFFPGQYPGGLPNSPSPLAAMLTSGLVGAGLGWGTGKLLGKILPEGYGQNLSRIGLILGGLAGAAPGAVWAATNLANNKSIIERWPNPRADQPDGPVVDMPWGTLPAAAPHGPFHQYLDELRTPRPGTGPPGHLRHYLDEVGVPRKHAADLEAVELSAGYQSAVDGFVKRAFGATGVLDEPTADVNIGALGQTLWQLGAPPNLAATTMGAMYAAQQLPAANARPGWATGRQLEQLAENLGNEPQRGSLAGMAINAAKDYVEGALGGALLNATVGTPWRASTYGAANLALGVIGSAVTRLFGG